MPLPPPQPQSHAIGNHITFSNNDQQVKSFITAGDQQRENDGRTGEAD